MLLLMPCLVKYFNSTYLLSKVIYMNMRYTRIIWFSISALTLLFDQTSKWLILQILEPYQNIHVFPGFFDLTLEYNKGAAFSFLAHAPGWQRWFFIALATIMSIVIFVWLIRLKDNEKVEGLGLALIL